MLLRTGSTGILAITCSKKPRTIMRSACSWSRPRDTVKGGARLLVQGRQVEQVRGGVLAPQVLQAVDVDLLLPTRGQQAKDQAGAALAGHLHVQTQLGD